MFLPSTVVFLDLTDTTLTERDTERIDDIDIVTALILHVHRAVQTAGNSMMPVVIGRRIGYTILFRYRRYTAIRKPFKELRYTELRRQIQVVRVRDMLLAVRVEINRIAIYYHYRHQLLTDQCRPYIFRRPSRLMVIEGNRVLPRICRIRQQDIVLVRYRYSRQLEIRGSRRIGLSVKLIIYRVVYHIRLVAVTTYFQNQRIGFILLIVLLYIPLGFDFSTFDIRLPESRPTGRSGTGCCEKTRPGVVRQYSIRILIVQTEVLIMGRMEVLVERQRVRLSLHRVAPRVQHMLFGIQVINTAVFLLDLRYRIPYLIRTEVVRVEVLRVLHALPGVYPTVEMTGTGKTETGTRSRVGKEVTLAVVLFKRYRNMQRTFIRSKCI